MSEQLPLAGLRVIALEQAIAAPLCSRHLADLGAEVIKIERPDEGDFARAYDSTAHGLSSWFVWLNRGKQSLSLDLKAARGQALARQLIAGADVVVQNFAPGALDRLGLGLDELRRHHPALVGCAISGYGDEGPYRERKAYDLLLQGEAGVLSVSGTPEQPVKIGISVVDIAAGMYAFSAILAALYRRRGSGVGATIRVSMLDAITEWMTPLALQAAGGRAPARAGDRHATIVPYGPYRVAGGKRVMLAIQNEREWRRLCAEVLFHPEWAADPRFERNERRVANRALLEPMIEAALADFSVEEAEARLEAASIAYSRVNDVSELFQHPQLLARDRFVAAGSENGPIDLPRAPFNIEGIEEPFGPVPAVGEHTDALLHSLGYDEAAITALRHDGVV